LAAWVLAAQAGGALVATAILTAMAVRQEQLLDRPDDAEQAASLVRLTGLDGREAGFFWVMAVTSLVAGLLILALTELRHYRDRWLAPPRKAEDGMQAARDAAQGGKQGGIQGGADVGTDGGGRAQ
jgi:hypothetical protein